MNEQELKFQLEQNKCLEYNLNHFYFDKWNSYEFSKNVPDCGLEVFITPQCTQKCKYCYLTQHMDELYPAEIRNHDQILKNLIQLLDYFRLKNLIIPRLDLFSGEIWATAFGKTVLLTILDELKLGLRIAEIMLPSNCNFILDDNTVKFFEQIKAEFATFNTSFHISISIDGAVLENISRPIANSKINNLELKNEAYYDKIFEFAFRNNFGFHPMLDAATMPLWKENFLWWVNQLKKFDKFTNIDFYNYIMFLEVRNDYWTDEAIISFIELLDFMFNYELSEFWNNDASLYLSDRILCNRNKINKSVKLPIRYSYSPLTAVKRTNEIRCSITEMLIVRLGDLAIVPCHRTSYDHLIYGKFISDGEKIIGIESKNATLMNTILTLQSDAFFECSTCPNKDLCIKGCLGSQFEATREIFQTIPSVCNLYFARTIYLYHKIHNIINKFNLTNIDTKLVDDVYNNLKNEKYGDVKKWEKLLMKLI